MACISKRARCLPAGSGGDLELGHSQMDAYLSAFFTSKNIFFCEKWQSIVINSRDGRVTSNPISEAYQQET